MNTGPTPSRTCGSISFLFIALLSVFLSGCDNSNYEAGKKVGYDEGYKEGYDKGHTDGVTENAFPGNGTTRAKWQQALYAVIAVLCAAKIIISIFVAIVFFTFTSASHEHTVAKALMGTLGGLLAFWMANSIDLFSTGTVRTGAKAFLLAPAAVSVLGHVKWTGAALVPAFFAVRYFEQRVIEQMFSGFLGSPKIHPWKAGLHVFALTMTLAVLLPMLLSCYNTPDIARYRGFDLAMGWLLGTIFYVAVRLMEHSPAAD